jgi:hypothetical protein
MAWLVLIGIGAGVTSALLFAALVSGQTFAVALFYLTPLPIMLAGVAWSPIAAAVAAVGAALLLGAFLGGWFVLAFLVGIGLPAVALAHLALLARPAANGGGGALEWYPSGRIVLAAALIAATAAALTIPAFGTDLESYRGALKTAFERVLRAQTGTAADKPLELPGTQDSGAVLDLLTVVMPPAAAVVTMITSLGNLWLAARIARASSRLARPWPDLGAMRFPAQAPLLLAAAIAGTFLPGLLGVVAALFSATLLVAYAVLGLAVIHGATRAVAARPIILTATWVAVFVLGWPILAATLLGLADHFIDVRGRVRGATNLSDHTPPNEQ